MYIIGSKIQSTLQKFEDKNVKINEEFTKGQTSYEIYDNRYDLKIIVDPKRWLGLKFHLKGTKMHYDIDTDLYDISNPKNSWFAKEIEDDMVTFLNGILESRLKVSRGKNNRVLKLAIPVSKAGHYMLIKQGRLLTSQKEINSVDLEKMNDKLSPLSLI